MLKQENNINDLLIRIAWINLFFFILVMVLTLGTFMGYDSGFIYIFPKTDILKVFIQSIRFQLSTFAYLNIPVLIVILLFPALNAAEIPKTVIIFVKFYYIAGFLLLFYLHLIALVSFQIIPKFNADFLSQFVVIFTQFDTKILIIFITFLSFIFLAMLIIFFLSVSVILKASEYEISDRQKNTIVLCILLVLCVLFARGKLMRHITHTDYLVTPSLELNKYAQNGAYKTIYDLKKFDPVNISTKLPIAEIGNTNFENSLVFDEEIQKGLVTINELKMLEESVN